MIWLLKSSWHCFTIFKFWITKFHGYFLSSKIFGQLSVAVLGLPNQKEFDFFIFRSVIDSKITNSRYFGIRNWWNHVMNSTIIVKNQKLYFVFIKKILSLSSKMTFVWNIFFKRDNFGTFIYFLLFFWGKPWIVSSTWLFLKVVYSKIE